MEQLPQPKKRRNQLLAIAALGLSGSCLAAFFYGKYFLEQQLSPLVQTELSKLLNRPVNLGGVDRFSWNGVRFGQTEIPTTDSEPNFLVSEAIDVQVDLWNYIQTRQLGLDVTVVKPHVFLRQDFANGQYLPQLIKPSTSTEVGTIDLRSVKIEDADLTLQPLNSQKAITLTKLNLSSNWQIIDPTRQGVQFQGAGQVLGIRFLNANIPTPTALRKAIAAQNPNGTLSITKAEFNLTNGSGNLQLRSQDIGISVIDGFFPNLPITPLQGKADGTVGFRLKAGNNQADIDGNIKIHDVSIKIPDLPKPVKNISGAIAFDGKIATLRGISGNYGSLVGKVNGTVNLSGLNLDIALEPTDIAKALASLDLKPSLPITGEIKLNGKIFGKKPQITATFSSTKSITVDRFVVSQVQGQIENKDERSLIFRQIKAKSNAIGNLVGNGILSLGQPQEIGKQPKPNSIGLQFNLGLENINSEAIAALYNTKLPIPIGAVTAQVQINGEVNNPTIRANFQAPQALYPTNGEVEIVDNIATLRNTRVQFPTGNLGLSGAISLDGKRPWQLELSSNGTPLSVFPSNLLPKALNTGNLFGLLKLSSPEGSFAPKDINANGNLDLQITQLPDLITATINWNGRNLKVPQLQLGNYVGGNGVISLDRDLAITNVDFNLRSLSRQQIQKFQAFLPPILQVTNGTIDFNAKISGTLNQIKLLAKISLQEFDLPELVALGRNINPSFLPQGKVAFTGEVSGVVNAASSRVNPQFNPQVKGIVKLVNLGLGARKFDPLITGFLEFNSQTGLTTNLQGKTDRLAVRLDPTFQPIDFNIKLASTSVVGNRLKNQDLAIKVTDLSLSLIGAIAGQPDLIDGSLSSELVVNLNNQIQAIGDIEITKPRFGQVQANRLAAKVNFNKGNLGIRNGLLQISPNQASKYKFELAYSSTPSTTLQGKIKIESGSVAELFNFLKLEEFSDITNVLSPPQYGKASTLASLPKVDKSQSFYQQLQYFSQIKARKDQQELSEATGSFPSLSEFKGSLAGEIKFALLPNQGLKLGFDLMGTGWDYGKFAVDDVKLKGSFNKDVLVLDTVKLQSGDRFGQITNTRITLKSLIGRVDLANFPVESLRPIPFFNSLPVDITGLANGFANLSGGLFNPKAMGKISLDNATINRQALDEVGGDFDYANGRFKFNGKVVTINAQSEPIQIKADVPYQFCPIPDGSSLRLLCDLVGSASTSLSKSLNIDISVKNGGLAFINILNAPVRWLDGQGTGMITIGGTLDDPKVRGSVTLDQAAFQVAGLPSDVTQVQGKINFNLDRFKASLSGKFSQGNFSANGVMAIANPNLITPTDSSYDNPLTIIADKLNLDLKNLYTGLANGVLTVRGSLLFPEVSGKVAISDGRVIIGEEAPADGRSLERDQFNIGFNNLLVSLGKNIQVTRFPLLNLLANGELTVNGSLRDIRPSGRVNIERGQINTISTRLRLDRDFENYADFVPSQGLNPNLNVRVLGTIPEVTRTRVDDSLINSFNPTNIPVSNLGAQRTIQIQASVTGSVQSPNIELRSSPPRSQSEILTLLGGGLLQQGGSDPTAVLANLAGGTIIGFLQDLIGDALNLSEFNLSPTTTSASGGNLSSIGLAAEAAISISPSFSIAVRSVLNDPSQVTNYTFRYRANPNTLLLTNTDLKGNNSVSVEYEARF
ncbi:translocation/assembly module TamB domain-containing protein [Synechococcus sp. PCC 7502]|uniref:translocation/assembly module TamB domain-containing protein n=1 Tax=Synechococcus sp. PCC 7502 TaxID=1173263 RepID=UPI00143A6DA0|nr:translocation/assembly module TamB domain-containing protein [Synechococcus sp. PCC 7502]